MTDAGTEETRHLSGLLLLGILVLPLVFSWFTLRRGYSSSVRAGAFLYLAVSVVVGLVGMTAA